MALFFLFPGLKAQEKPAFLPEPNVTIQSGINFKFNPRTEKFRLPLDSAAVHFPELQNCKIEVRRQKITTMMAARPKRNFLFHSMKNRTYVILITDKPGMRAEEIYHDLSTSATVGVFGHELSHIVSYKNKSNADLLWFGVKYMLNKKKIENKTDMIAIDHGFGPGLVEYTSYIHNSPKVNKKYLLKKKKYYYSSNELESKMHENH